jgi:hypothetical protein
MFKVFKDLLTRPQFHMVERGDEASGEMTVEFMEIPGSCRVPEENEHRLDLAKMVLSIALGALEAEHREDARERDEKRAELARATAQGHDFTPGGYS